MIKYIVLAFIAAGLIGRFIFNAKTSSAIQGLAKKLKTGKLLPGDFAGIFDILITSFEYEISKNIFENFSLLKTGKQTIQGRTYHILETKLVDNKAVVLASVTTKRDTQYVTSNVKTTLSVSLYLVNDPENGLIQYFSECPIDKEHEEDIREFITGIHGQLI
jgi:hypothetical protein